MLKRIIPVVLSVIYLSFAVYAADEVLGFDPDEGHLTETANEYFFSGAEAIIVDNKEVFTDPIYSAIVAGSDVYLPIYVYPDGGRTSVQATDKMIKTDNVTISSKVLVGKDYVGNIELVDGKKLKLKGVKAGAYARIPLVSNYDKTGRSLVTLRLVLSVNDVTYERTQVSLKCKVMNRETEIDKNSVYGAKTPAQFHVHRDYSGEVTFDFGGNIKYTAKVKAGKTYYLNLSKEPAAEIKEMYPDAYLEFYNFLGDRDTFSSTGTLEIPVNRSKLSKKGTAPSLYVYRVDGKSLTALGSGSVSFNSKTDKLSVHTKTLGSYVLSNVPLLKEISGAPDGDILKSGYADVNYSPDPQALSLQEASSGQPTSSAALPALSSGSDDGYVPEESAGLIPNNNPSMGLAINTANKSSDNPSTSDTAMPYAAAFAGIACSAAALACLVKKRDNLQ